MNCFWQKYLFISKRNLGNLEQLEKVIDMFSKSITYIRPILGIAKVNILHEYDYKSTLSNA